MRFRETERVPDSRIIRVADAFQPRNDLRDTTDGHPTTELVISCEHASHRLPTHLDLGVTTDELLSHVSWDHGAWPIARHLASKLVAPLHGGTFSRLYVDLNRNEHRDDVIPATSFGTPVPGNQNLTAGEREQRIAAIHRPYRRGLRRTIEGVIARGHRCFHLSIHSFTPVMHGKVRGFDLGILFDPSHAGAPDLASRLIEDLKIMGFDTRGNEPYPGTVDSVVSWLAGTSESGFATPGMYVGIGFEVNHAITERPGGIAAVSQALESILQRFIGPPRADARTVGQPIPAFEFLGSTSELSGA